MRELRDKVAALTGAASGIGRELAIQLGREGCALALADIDEKGLEETIGMTERPAIRITSHVVDVRNRDEVYRYAEEVWRAHGQVDILVNNAATMVFDTLEDVGYDDFQRVIETNFWGVVYGVKAFLPYLKQRPEAHIVNVASANGILTTPNNGPYCVAKFAVKSFTEALGQELHGSTVRVSCILPGGVKTNIIRNTRFFKQANRALTRDETIQWFERASVTSPEKAARTIIRAMKKNKSRILVGADAYFIDLAKRLMPVWSTWYAGHKIRNLTLNKGKWFP
ncbi:MAG: SDR family oxidoreductase [Deltaproteobacteria bacterium]|nr:SDR family oxidoreductase [Deltaproteobacteria bacterium]